MTLQMPVVWTDRHRGHAPDGGYWLGVREPGDEEPVRGDTLREALLEIKTFDLPLTGKLVIDGHRVDKTVYLLTVQKGTFVPLATLVPTWPIWIV